MSGLDFAQTLATLPTVAHLRGLDVVNADGQRVHHIPHAAGKLGSLRIYHALALQFGGQLSADAVAQGLRWFAEHTATAQAQPGSHPNIDLLLAQRQANQGYRLVPLPR